MERARSRSRSSSSRNRGRDRSGREGGREGGGGGGGGGGVNGYERQRVLSGIAFFQSALPGDPESVNHALSLMKEITKQQKRRAVTDYDVFYRYFDGKKSQRSTLIDFKDGLKRMSIDTFGTHNAPMKLFRCLDIAGRQFFDLQNWIVVAREYQNAVQQTTEKKIRNTLREEELKKSFERIASSPTESSRRWKSSQMYHRTFETSSNGACDDDKDHDPRKLLAGMCDSLERRSLRDWDIFMICDANRSGSVTPMEFANGLHRLQFNYTPRQLKRLWEAIDMDRSGRIEFEELRLALTMASKMGAHTLPGQGEGGKRMNEVMIDVPRGGEEKEEEKKSMEEEKKSMEGGKEEEGKKRGGRRRSGRRSSGGGTTADNEDERTRILKQRAAVIRRRIARPRLKVLLSKMRAAMSSWMNHDRHAFLVRHGGDGGGGGDGSGSDQKGEDPELTSLAKLISSIGDSNVNALGDAVGDNLKNSACTAKEVRGEFSSSSSSSKEGRDCHMTIGKVKQQLRTMVPFTTKEVHAFVCLLGVEKSVDDKIMLTEFDHLLEKIEREMKINVGPRNAHSPIGSRIGSSIGSRIRGVRNSGDDGDGCGTEGRKEVGGGRRQMETFLIEGSIDEPTNTPTKTVVSTINRMQRPTTILLNHLIQKMQHQLQRSELLNDSLFSGIHGSFKQSSPKSLRMQLNLLGFNVTLIDIHALQLIFEDSLDIHYVLVCRKIQNACYSMIDDTILNSLANIDMNGDGYVVVQTFVDIVAKHISLQTTEKEALLAILLRCSHKEERNNAATATTASLNSGTPSQTVCCYLDMFTKSPTRCHGKVLKESVQIGGGKN